MGLKGYRLWVMGKLDSNVQSPTTTQPKVHSEITSSFGCRSVALQVAFERQTLKPVFHLIGVRLWV
jgi:hypothetical protein